MKWRWGSGLLNFCILMCLLALSGCKPTPSLGPRVQYKLEVDGDAWFIAHTLRYGEYRTEDILEGWQREMMADSITAWDGVKRLALKLQTGVHSKASVRVGEQVYKSLWHDWVDVHARTREALAQRLDGEPHLVAIVEQAQPLGPIYVTLNANPSVSDTLLLTWPGKLMFCMPHQHMRYVHDFYSIKDYAQDTSFVTDTFNFYKTLDPPKVYDPLDREMHYETNLSTIAFVDVKDTAKVGQFIRKICRKRHFLPAQWTWNALPIDSQPNRFELLAISPEFSWGMIELRQAAQAHVECIVPNQCKLQFQLQEEDVARWKGLCLYSQYSDLAALLDRHFLSISRHPRPQPLDEDKLEIDLNLSTKEAHTLPIILQAPPLPAKLRVTDREIVSTKN